MAESARTDDLLESRVVAAHGAYLDALIALERLHHRAVCPVCAPAAHAMTIDKRALDEAQRRKEACRVRFRDLVVAFGSLPADLPRALPPEETSCALYRMLSRQSKTELNQ